MLKEWFLVTYAFIRHGQTDWNLQGFFQGSTDIPLNDTGREQALEAARLLADGPWTAIVSSPLSRARETAEIIARELGIELGPAYDELIERGYGPLEGKSTANIPEAPWNPRTGRDYDGAEPITSVIARGRAGLARIAADYPDADVVIVCHGTIIRYTLTDLIGRGIDGINNGSISEFALEGEEWRVLTVNGQPLVAIAETEEL